MFKESTLKFLKGLKRNNNRDWFEKNRPAYEEARADFEDFIQSLITIHGKSDPDLQPLIAKKCIFRINRDVRFSKTNHPTKQILVRAWIGAEENRGSPVTTFTWNRAIAFLAGVYGCLHQRI